MTTASSLLECLETAKEIDGSEVLVQTSFRIGPTTKRQVEQICESEGTTLSTFLRACCENLVSGYNSVDPVTRAE